jgi:glucose/arabinose dehydrogenase
VRRFLLVAVLVAGSLLPAASPAGAVSPRPANFATGGDVVEFGYVRFLGREPDPVGLNAFRPQLEANGADPVAFLDFLAHSGEYEAYVGAMLRAYHTAYGRTPDVGGARFWLDRRALAPGQSFFQLSLNAFLGAPEFHGNYDGTTDREFVRRVYLNALGREPDQGGSDFWTSRVGTQGRTLTLFQISESAEHRSRRRIEVEITGVYLAMLDRLPDPGGLAAWTSFFQNGGSSRGFIGAVWNSTEFTLRLPTVPTLTVQTRVSGLSFPWGIAFTPDGTMLYTQRGGSLDARRSNGTLVHVANGPSDLLTGNIEGGFLDLAVDPDYATNRRIYICQSRKNGSNQPLDVAVFGWTVAADFTSAARDASPLVSGIPVGSGRHNGCRVMPDPTTPGVLYIGTGDAAIGTNPQDLTNLGGKLLRVSSTTGEGVAGNPFINSGNANTRRIVGFGHRNIQGLTTRTGTNPVQVWTAEHGSDRDDELNISVSGGNYGWNPVPGYNEQVPMTDLPEFPGAVSAAWTSGFPTVATSGTTFLRGCVWGAWNDHAAVALL